MSTPTKAMSQLLHNLNSQLNHNIRQAQSLYFNSLVTISTLISIVGMLNPTSFHINSSQFLTVFTLLSHLVDLLEELQSLPKDIYRVFQQATNLLVTRSASQLLDHPDLLGQDTLIDHLYTLKRFHYHYPTTKSTKLFTRMLNQVNTLLEYL